MIIDTAAFAVKIPSNVNALPNLQSIRMQKVDKLTGMDNFLNADQQNAVFADHLTNLRIIAGPGTGKTTVLINRIIFFLNKLRTPSYRILTLTFTRKACQNIKDRIAKLSDLTNLNSLPVYTYHGFCY